MKNVLSFPLQYIFYLFIENTCVNPCPIHGGIVQFLQGLVLQSEYSDDRIEKAVAVATSDFEQTGCGLEVSGEKKCSKQSRNIWHAVLLAHARHDEHTFSQTE